MTSPKTSGCKCGGKCGKAKKDCTCGTKKVAPVDQTSTSPATPVAPVEPADQIAVTPVAPNASNTTSAVKKAGCGCA